MSYIEIRDGVSINTDEIESLEKISDFETMVFTHHNKYKANFPYLTLLDLISMGVEKEEPKEVALSEEVTNIIKQQDHFVG